MTPTTQHGTADIQWNHLEDYIEPVTRTRVSIMTRDNPQDAANPRLLVTVTGEGLTSSILRAFDTDAATLARDAYGMLDGLSTGVSRVEYLHDELPGRRVALDAMGGLSRAVVDNLETYLYNTAVDLMTGITPEMRRVIDSVPELFICSAPGEDEMYCRVDRRGELSFHRRVGNELVLVGGGVR